MPASIDGYLSMLGRSIQHSRRARRRILEEVRAHLEDQVEVEQARGASRPGAELSAVERLGHPAAMGREFPAGRTLRTPAIVLIGAATVAVLLGAASVERDASHLYAAKGTTYLPAQAAAERCIAGWNAPGNAPFRRAVAERGPFTYPLNKPGPGHKYRVTVYPTVRDAGAPTRAFVVPAERGGHCGIQISFRRGTRVRTFALGEGLWPRPRPHWGYLATPARLRTYPSTAVLPDGSLSPDVRPPRATGSWGGHLTLTADITSPQSVPIVGQKTCVRYTVEVNRPAALRSFSRKNLVSGVVKDRPYHASYRDDHSPNLVVPGRPLYARTCFFWAGHADDPGAEVPHFTHPYRRQVEFYAVDADTRAVVTVSLRFRIVRAAHAPGRWRLVVVNPS